MEKIKTQIHEIQPPASKKSKNNLIQINKKIKKTKQISIINDNNQENSHRKTQEQQNDQETIIDNQLIKICESNTHLLSKQNDDEVEEIEQSNKNASSLLSDKTFQELPICENTHQAIKRMKFIRMTHIQARSIPHLLKGRDVLGAAKTGSGKTLGFLIPAFELMYRAQFTQMNGTAIIILSPTRELAQQTFDVSVELNHFHNKTLGLLIGGANRKQEAIKLQRGVNVIIATPGRLLDHLQNTKFIYHNLLCLIIDEADQLLKIGYEEEMNRILELLPSKRQTVLFSATQTKKVDDLARLSLKQPIYIGVDDIAEQATVDRLEQGYVLVPADKRFLLLFTFLRLNSNKKIMVFFSSCNSVKFHCDLLNYVDVQVMDIHGKQKQAKRTNTFYEFANTTKGILLCTDVAARGLDIPQVDWIVQYDPPDDTRDYIHRVGRTCRGLDGKGKALIFLLPEEKDYLQHLRAARVTMNEFEFPEQRIANVQEQMDKLIEKNYHLNKAAFEAYKSYLHAYQSHSLKDCYDVNNLDLSKVCRAFGFKIAPRVSLNISLSDRTKRKQKISKFVNKSNQFKTNQNYQNNRQTGDTRQFMR